LVPACAKPLPTRPARHVTQTALRKVMMRFLPSGSFLDELVPSPYFAALMAGNYFAAPTASGISRGPCGALIFEHRAAQPRPTASGHVPPFRMRQRHGR
jgi:hypothetical protein